MTKTWADTIAGRVQVDERGCHLWTGPMYSNGYGQVYWQGRGRLAHRASYEQVRGPIPAGLDLDHLCRVRRCMNPEHLEAVTRRENLLRGVGLAAQKAEQTECIHGHPFTVENTYRAPNGTRHCRTCRARVSAESRARAAARAA